MGILAILPAILGLFGQVMKGIEGQQRSGVISNLIGTLFDNPTVGGIMKVFEGYVTNLSTEQRLELEAQVQTLLAQVQIDTIEAQSDNFFYAGWRPCLAWGLTIALLMSVLFEPTLNYILSFFHIHTPAAFVLSPLAMAMLSSLCGIYMSARTLEKLQAVNKQH